MKSRLLTAIAVVFGLYVISQMPSGKLTAVGSEGGGALKDIASGVAGFITSLDPFVLMALIFVGIVMAILK